MRDAVKTDYRVYRFKLKELLLYCALYAAASCAVGWLFFGRPAAGAVFGAGMPLYIREVRKSLAARRRKKLTAEFRDALNLFAVSLKAGYSVERALPLTAAELTSIYGKEAMIVREFRYMAGQLSFQVPAEQLLQNLALRSGAEEIRNFAAVFATAKRSGGNLPKIVSHAAETISGRIEVEKEIEATLSAKKMEHRIMSVMPCGIILYMRAGSPGFLEVMYTTGLGVVIMAAALVLYALAVYWGMQIVKIEV
ncbi:MAG: type II secretion system F family protein [Lachnospiraceae bacterium]|nr:type II secretion system F family protein [Lachnospiraceae bacterium]